jgi:hypothetical protein
MGGLTIKGTDGLLQLAGVGIRSVVASVCRRKPKFALAVQSIVVLHCKQIISKRGKAMLNLHRRVTEMIVRQTSSSVATIEYIQLIAVIKLFSAVLSKTI